MASSNKDVTISSSYDSIEGFITKDGSIIKELIHPHTHGNTNLSVAEATIKVCGATFRHYHTHSEEVYHVRQGKGQVIVGSETIEVKVGDSVCIPAGVHHHAVNTGDNDFIFYCICSPPYTHETTVLVN